jgi:adenine-specific DNA-methyltransferase
MSQLYNKKMLEGRRQNLRKQQTEAERIFWNMTRGRKFSNLKFRRQFSVGPYILDFYCPEIGLAVEIDGGQHAAEVAYDDARTKFINKLGIKVIRFWNNDLTKNPSGVYDELARIVATPPDLTLPSP